MSETEWFQELRTDEARHERSYWRRVGFAIFLGIVLGVLMLPLHGAQAAEVFRNTDDKGGPAVLTLHKEPCSSADVLKHITAPFRPLFRRATLFYWGRDWASCWYDHEGLVISVEEQGAQFQPLPRRAFKEESI